jgi:uncharacterized protein (TIGR00290 family)
VDENMSKVLILLLKFARHNRFSCHPLFLESPLSSQTPCNKKAMSYRTPCKKIRPFAIQPLSLKKVPFMMVKKRGGIMDKKRIVVSYSGGKDSTLALYRLIQTGEWEIDSLLTTIIEDFGRTSAHGVREVLLEKQANALGFPLRKVYIPAGCLNETYMERMGKAVEQMIKDGVTHVMFGDIHLEDVKAYREKMLEQTPLEPVFPLWKEDPDQLIQEFLELGFETIVTCVDGEKLDPSFAGRVIDQQFVKDLPSSVDPCGENGEYHTFVFHGPIFNEKIRFSVSGEKTIAKDVHTNKERFYFVDLIPEP